MKLKKDKKGYFVEIKIDPYKGAARLALDIGNMFEGYRFVELIRRGDSAKIYVEKTGDGK